MSERIRRTLQGANGPGGVPTGSLSGVTAQSLRARRGELEPFEAALKGEVERARAAVAEFALVWGWSNEQVIEFLVDVLPLLRTTPEELLAAQRSAGKHAARRKLLDDLDSEKVAWIEFMAYVWIADDPSIADKKLNSRLRREFGTTLQRARIQRLRREVAQDEAA